MRMNIDEWIADILERWKKNCFSVFVSVLYILRVNPKSHSLHFIQLHLLEELHQTSAEIYASFQV